MAKFFIDITDNAESFIDEEGSELPTLEKACNLAIGMLPEIQQNRSSSTQRRTFTATVRDAQGKLHYRATLTFVGERLE